MSGRDNSTGARRGADAGQPSSGRATPSGRAAGKSALLREMSRVLSLEREVVKDKASEPGARLLAAWQARRLAATYEDFAARARYRDAVHFFLNDLYGPGDFSQRDTDLKKVLPVMTRMLPEAALLALTDALELHALTMEFDRAMLGVLQDELGMSDALDPTLWVQAYQRCGRRAERERQIALTVSAGRQLEQVVEKPLVYSLVRLARGPAKAAGFGALQDFVERGFKAFRSMRGASEFIDAVEQRELRLLEDLFTGKVPQAWHQEPGTLTLEDLPT